MKTQIHPVASSSTSLRAASLLIALLGAGGSSLAAATWDGGAGTSNWGDAANWNPDTLPAAGSEAILGAAAPAAINMNNSTSPRRITFDSTATTGITVTLATAWRLNTALTGITGGIGVSSGNAHDNELATANRSITLGPSSGFTGNQEMTFSNNGTGTLRVTATTGFLRMGNASTTDGAVLNLKFDGTGRTAVGAAMQQAASHTNSAVFNLSQTGSGTTTLGGANTYNGTTSVTAGKLFVDGTHVGGGAYAVANGVLGGAGAITTAGNAGVTVGSGGKLFAGSENTVGTLTMNLGTGSLDLGGAVVGDSQSLFFRLGSASDKIALGADSTLHIGTDALGFGDFVFSAASGFDEGTYTLFETSTSISGTLAGTQLTGTIEGLGATLSLSGDGRSVLLTVAAIPEPANAGLLLACLAGAGALSRRRRRTPSA